MASSMYKPDCTGWRKAEAWRRCCPTGPVQPKVAPVLRRTVSCERRATPIGAAAASNTPPGLDGNPRNPKHRRFRNGGGTPADDVVDERRWQGEERAPRSSERSTADRAGGAPKSYTSKSHVHHSPSRTLNLRLQDARSCLQLQRVLQEHNGKALTAINVATAWVRLGNLRPFRPRSVASEAGAAAGAADSGEGADSNAAESAACSAVARRLLEPTAGAAAGMDIRQLANTLWAMAKVKDDLPASNAGGDRGDRDDGSRTSSSRLTSAVQRLQQRAVDLLQPSPPSPSPSPPSGSPGGDVSAAAPGGEKRGAPKTKGAAAAMGPGAGGTVLLDLRDAAQLWYGMGGLQHPWSQTLVSALVEATLRAMEGMLAAASEDAKARSSGGDGGGASVEGRTAAAQLVFRMGILVGANMQGGHKARLAAIIDRLSYNGAADDGAPLSEAVSSTTLGNPDCLLTGAYLLRLQLPPAAVRRLHDATLNVSRAAAARAGRTAMARALHSAVQMGLQPSGSEARRWQQRLVVELGGGDGSGSWRSEELSWTMLALSGCKAYRPDVSEQRAFAKVVSKALRRARANDATRIRAAAVAWDLPLMPREQALLAQKAGPEAWDEWEERRAREREEDEGPSRWRRGRLAPRSPRW